VYGTWAGWGFAGIIFLLLLGLVLLITPWGVFIAVLIALIAAAGFAIGMSSSRQQTREAEQPEEGEGERAAEARQPRNPRSEGEPVSGEG
jgi:Na+-transporting methylmalonyl-CoA/oxaloacetate decarboxylase gamma subunit